jgi:putative ABC transport system permease protein
LASSPDWIADAVIGRLLLISRLVAGDIRRRKLQSLLLVAMIIAATAALTVALALRQINQHPFAVTRSVTRGPDVVVTLGARPGASPSPKAFDSLRRAPTVKQTAGPFPVAFVHLRRRGAVFAVQAQGRDHSASAIDRPKVVSGSWVRPGGVVLERALAEDLHVDVGDAVTIGGRKFVVNGLAVSTAQPFYPAQVPGVVWVTRSAAQSLAAASGSGGEILDLDLTHLTRIDAFLNSRVVNHFAQRLNAGHRPFQFSDRHFIRHDDHKLVALNDKVLLVGGPLLALLAVVGIATLVAGRMAEQDRRIGLLKAVGGGPVIVTTTLLAETELLTLTGAVLGLIAGELVAPSLSHASDGLLGSDGSTRLSPAPMLLIVAIACAVAAVTTLGPAIRGARSTTMRALAPDIVVHRRRRKRFTHGRTPPPALLLASRLVGRRTRRTLFSAAGLTVAVATIVIALIVQHDASATARAAVTGPTTHSAVTSQATHVMLVLSAVLVALAAIIATFAAWTAVLDARRPAAVARALGATPRQITTGLAVSQLGPAFIAVCGGIPAGLLLYAAAGGHLSETHPPVLSLLAVIPATLAIVAALTSIPARITASQQVAQALRAD